MIVHYIKLAIRNLKRNKVQSVISILGLAVGILTFTLFAYMARSIATVNEKYAHHPQMAEVYALNKEEGYVASRFQLGDLNRLSKVPGVDAVAASDPDSEDGICYFSSSTGEDRPFFSDLICVNRAFLDVFSVQFTSGSAGSVFDQPGSVLISESMSLKVYGVEDPIGKSVRNGERIYTIRGVMKDLPRPNNISAKPIDLIGCISDGDELTEMRFVPIVLVSKHSSVAEINKQIESSKFVWGDPLSPLYPELTGINDLSQGDKGEMLMYFLIGFLVLLTGLINFFTFIVGAFYNRIRELTLRKSVGASVFDLVLMLFIELGILVMLATVLSFCLSETLVPAGVNLLNDYLGLDQSRPLYVDVASLFYHQIQYFVLVLVVCMAVACFSVYRLHRMPAMQGMRGGTQKGGKHILRNSLLGFQFLISLLFFGTVAVLHMQNREMDRLLFVTFPDSEQTRTYGVDLAYPQLAGLEQEVVRQLAGSSSVEDILCLGPNKLGLRSASYRAADGSEFPVQVLEAGANLAGFIHLPILQGKAPENFQSVAVSRSLSEKLVKAGNSQHLLLENQNYSVSGVVDDICFSIKGDQDNVVLVPLKNPGFCYVKAKPGREDEVVEHIENVMRQWIPETLPLQFLTFDLLSAFENMIFEILRNIFLFFALTCLIITSLGVYAAITLDTEKRQKEVAIRKINGASFRSVVFLFGRLYLSLFILASAFALPVLWSGSNYLLSLLPVRYDVNRPEFWLCVLLLVALLIVAIIGYRLYRIARLNPAEIIKNE